MRITTQRLNQLAADTANPTVIGITIDAGEMADLLLRARALEELRDWARRAVCFIGAVGQGHATDEAADELIFCAHSLISDPPPMRSTHEGHGCP